MNLLTRLHILPPPDRRFGFWRTVLLYLLAVIVMLVLCNTVLSGLLDGDLQRNVASLLLAHVPACDILHENGEEPPEPASLLPEQCGLRDAPRVHGREDDASALVVAPVELEHSHHVAQLAVL